MLTFEEYLQREKAVKEDGEIAAGPAPAAGAGDVISQPTGTTAADVLGPCDHNHSGGFMGKDCNHLPKPMMLEPMRRINKRKKRKSKYGVILSDAELDRDMILALHSIDELQMQDYVLDNFGDDFSIRIHVEAVVYNPKSGFLFLKVRDLKKFGSSAVKYCIADFDIEAQKLVVPSNADASLLQAMTSAEAKKALKDIVASIGHHSEDGMKLFVVWGDV